MPHTLSAPGSSAHSISKKGKQELKREAFMKSIRFLRLWSRRDSLNDAFERDNI